MPGGACKDPRRSATYPPRSGDRPRSRLSAGADRRRRGGERSDLESPGGGVLPVALERVGFVLECSRRSRGTMAPKSKSPAKAAVPAVAAVPAKAAPVVPSVKKTLLRVRAEGAREV